MSSPLPTRPTKYCHACVGIIDAMAVVCPQCGVMQHGMLTPYQSEKRILPAAILCAALGVFGAHRFYAGKTGTAVLQLFTLGGLGIWALVDFILIVLGQFKDAQGEQINEWT